MEQPDDEEFDVFGEKVAEDEKKREIKNLIKEYYKNLLVFIVPAFIGGAGIVGFRFLRWFGLLLAIPLAILVVWLAAEPLLDEFLDMLLGTGDEE